MITVQNGNISSNNPIGVLKWVGITFLGWFIGIVFIILISNIMELFNIEGLQFQLGVGIGIGMGLIQYYVLRKKLGIGFEWFWASVIGIGLPFILFDIIRFSTMQINTHEVYLIICGGLSGLFSGLFYHFILKRKDYNKTILMVVTNTAGWLFTAYSIVRMNHVDYSSPDKLQMLIVNIVFILFGGFILGLLNGLSLTIIQKNRKIIP